MTSIEAKIAEIAKARARAQQSMAEQVALAKLDYELAALNNPRVQAAKIALSQKDETAKQLDTLIELCQAVVADLPIYNPQTRENRKWVSTTTYAYGTDVTKIVTLLKGIKFSALAHRERMFICTGLSEAIVEETVAAIGAEPYYQKSVDVITETMPMDIEAFKLYLNIIEEILGVRIDTSRITQSNVDRQYLLAEIRATAAQSANHATQALPTLDLN